MAAEIHVNDIGTSFRVTARDEDDEIIDLSSATVLLIVFQDPDGNNKERDGSLVTDGTDGVFEYVTQDGDLDVAGRWKIQGIVEVSGSRWHGNITKFKVFANLED